MYTWLVRRIQIYLDDSQYAALCARARDSGKSLATTIREILDEHLSEDRGHDSEDRLVGVIGFGEGDGSPFAENYEDYLYGSDLPS